MAKPVIIDTNVILYDPKSIFRFEERDVYVPVIVLEELDSFKSGQEVINRNARIFVRILNDLTQASPMNGGFAMGKGFGKIYMHIDEKNFVSGVISADSNDNRILNAAHNLKGTLVTKDINLRMKAKSLLIDTEDYNLDDVPNVSELDIGFRVIQNTPSDIIDDLFKSVSGKHMELPEGLHPFVANEYINFRYGKQSILTRYNQADDKVYRVLSAQVSNIKPRNMEQTFAIDALINPNISLVALSGKAGTGKTLLSIAAALSKKKDFRQIFLARPIMPLGRDIGYLPGDIETKLDPYMAPIWDNIKTIKEYSSKPELIEKMITDGKISVEALTFIRGRSLPKIFFIIDEAQNLTPHEVKTIITRAGNDTKIVFTGDIYQIDHPYLDSQSNGLSYLIHKFRNQPMFAHVNLHKGERSDLAELAAELL